MENKFANDVCLLHDVSNEKEKKNGTRKKKSRSRGLSIISDCIVVVYCTGLSDDLH